MSRICGYRCEHNKSGVCQISVCDKKSNISDKTEVQTFTRYIDPTITELQQENKQLKIQISAREEEYKKLEDKLVETENWLRPAILQLMDCAKQDYYWITDQQIDNAKLVPIEFTVMGDGCVKFKKLERGISK